MSLSLTNRDDIVANSFSLITANCSVVEKLMFKAICRGAATCEFKYH
jgi:hypothetical protein